MQLQKVSFGLSSKDHAHLYRNILLLLLLQVLYVLLLILVCNEFSFSTCVCKIQSCSQISWITLVVHEAWNWQREKGRNWALLLQDAQSWLKRIKNIPLVVERGSSFPKVHLGIKCSFSSFCLRRNRLKLYEIFSSR